MSILMAEASDIHDVSIGDEGVLIGREWDDEVPVKEIAPSSDTIDCEFLARPSPAISRSGV
jgi:alanine racemase